MSETEEARVERYTKVAQVLEKHGITKHGDCDCGWLNPEVGTLVAVTYRQHRNSELARAVIAVADEEQAELRADRNVAYGMLTSAQHRAEVAEAEVERLTRELQTMDHFAEVSEQVERASNAAHARAEAAEAELADAHERLRQAEERLAAVEALAEAWEAVDAKNPSIPGMRTALAAELRTALGRPRD